ncbi:MAG: 2Fe-2S iron-sulfur cluster binding domain-containing protein [Deltaproteobacteria bacterium]|nr:2Fe-2S iron-sulfur cluster binding domain-containing protein [Deltaproteobacteria bacterium]
MPRVTFLPDDVSAEVAEGDTILDASKACGAPEGDACGGNCACSTCHVHVLEGIENLSEMQDDEADRLDMAFDVRPSSRLGCQARLVGKGDVVVEITQESRDAYYNEHPTERRAG